MIMSGTNTLYGGTLLNIVMESAKAITPHILGVDAVDELPEADPRASVEVLEEWRESGIPEFHMITTLAVIVLNLYSLVRRGHLFPRLDFGSQAALLERLFDSKSRLVGRLLFFLATPVVTAYYSRVDVQVLLGFDIPALEEESERRRVTRNGGPLPEKNTAPGEAGPSSEGAER